MKTPSPSPLPDHPSTERMHAIFRLYQTGQMKKAEQACLSLLKTHRQSFKLWNVFGVVLQRQGKLPAAVRAFNKAVELKPDFAEAYCNRGNALTALGQLDPAARSYAWAIKFKPDYAPAYNNLGNALKAMGQLKAALNTYDQAIARQPDYAEAYNNRGIVLRDLGQLKAAVKSYERAIALRPDYAESHHNLGVARHDLGQLETALGHYDRAIARNPHHAAALSNRGNALRDLGQLDAARKSYEQAIHVKPDYPEAYNNLGGALCDGGQLDAAVKSYEQAIRIKPDYGEAHRNLSLLKKYTAADDAHLELMRRLFSDSRCSESVRMHLGFALAKAYDDLAQYDTSFQYLEAGNRRRNNQLNYRIDLDKKLLADVMTLFRDVPPFEPTMPQPLPVQPIFIIGMPRSGTSLVEQILASHPRVHGAGELETMNQLVGAMMTKRTHPQKIMGSRQLFKQEIKRLRTDYLAALTALNVAEPVITDKMPLNFRWVGFILSAFPEAKIIHLNRDPRATCWSIYKHYFASKGNGYAYDMDKLAAFYQLYREVMAFWRCRFTHDIYELCYEDLTENQEEETRRLLSFCGLEWEVQCLEFQKTKRIVKTASAAQVRQKMVTGRSDLWRNYAAHLKPLINGLAS